MNQPRVGLGIVPIRYIYCHNHDYAYYPSSWTADDGTHFKAGYYDENGNYYENVKVENATEDLPAILTCEYCGTETKFKWTEGSIPNCPNCGAPLSMKEAPTDTTVNEGGGSSVSEDGTVTATKKKRSFTGIIVAGVLFLLLMSSCVRGCSVNSSNTSSYSGQNSSSQGLQVIDTNDYNSGNSGTSGLPAAVSDQPLSDTILMLRDLGGGIYDYETSDDSCDKLLIWSDPDEAYFDEETGFWLWYNEDAGTWQYWIEGVSNSYGDYGWMECEGDEWYVEVSANNWQLYDGDTSQFWHIRNAYD